MIGFQIIPTSLELNGPTLSFLEQPVGITTIESTVSFTGIVTSTPVGTGHLSYQWYEVGVGAVGSASTAEVGIGTTLTLTDLTYEDDSGRQFYLESTYVPSAYQSSSPVIIGGRILDTTLSNTSGIGSTEFRLTAATDVIVGDELTIDTNTGIAISDAPIISIGAGIHTTVEIGTGYTSSSVISSGSTASIVRIGTARSTGKALNGPLNSNTVALGISPTISITTQPGIATVVTDASASFGIAATVTDGTINNLTYQWQEDGSDLTDSTTVTGSATTSLTISSDTVGVSTIRCVVSHPSASNSPLNSNTVDFNVVSPTARKVLYVEEFDVNATLHSTQEVDLVDGALEIIPDQTGIAATSNWNRIYSIYAPEDDISVKITLEGAAGEDSSSTNTDGLTTGEQGGTSTFNLTLEQGQEYVANLGAAIWPSGGFAPSDEDGAGGGGSFFYKGGELLVACGGGSGNSSSTVIYTTPGSGGGIGVNPTLTPIGLFPGGESSANTTETIGGRVGGCTIGDFWETQGIAPCASIGSTTFFTGKDGQKTSNMNGVSVIRGYKAGLNYQFNAGNGTPTGGGGGGGGALGGNINRGGVGFDGLGTATGTIGGNTRKVGVIKIEAV